MNRFGTVVFGAVVGLVALQAIKILVEEQGFDRGIVSLAAALLAGLVMLLHRWLWRVSKSLLEEAFIWSTKDIVLLIGVLLGITLLYSFVAIIYLPWEKMLTSAARMLLFSAVLCLTAFLIGVGRGTIRLR